MSAVHLIGIAPEHPQNSEPDVIFEAVSESADRPLDYIYFDPQTANQLVLITETWLSLISTALLEERSGLPSYPPWPEQSRISSYKRIVSYQYYISALNTVS